MPDEQPLKLTEIAANAEVGDDAKALLRDDLNPPAYLDVLSGKALFEDALQFFAHAVPCEVALRWAVDCAKAFEKPEDAAKGAASLAATEKWLQSKADADRWDAKNAAEKAKMATPADCVALAAFFSGPSISPPDAPPTPPPAFMGEKMAAGAVQIAVMSYAPGKVTESYKKAIEMGRELAKAKGVAQFAG